MHTLYVGVSLMCSSHIIMNKFGLKAASHYIILPEDQDGGDMRKTKQSFTIVKEEIILIAD